MQVADGSMSWKQGAFQVGMSAATACIGVGASELSGMVGGAASAATEAGSRTMTQIAVENVSRTAANTLVSGISFDGEGLSYDKERMTSSRTWLAAGVTAGAGTLAAGYNLSGFSSAAVNGIGSSLSAGITTGDWSKSFQTGAISAAGNYLGGLMAGGITQGLGTNNAYTQALISNYTTFGMRKLLGGDEEFDMGAIGQVDTMNLVVQDMYQGYKKGQKEEEEKSRAKEKDEELKNRRDELIKAYGHKKGGKMFTAELKTEEKADKQKSMEAQKQRAEERAKDPFAKLDDALSGVFVSLGRGLGQTMKDIGETIQKGAQMAANGVVTAGTLAVGGVSWLIDEAAALGKSAMSTVSSWMDDDEKPKDNKTTELKQKANYAEGVKGKDVADSLDKLSKMASQKGNGYALKELEKALKNIPGGDKLNAKEILGTSCNALTMWITLKEAGANVGEFGDFFEKQVKAKNINADDATVGSPYAIAGHYTIDGKKLDVGFIDGKNNPLEGFNKYEKLLKSGQVSNGEVFFKTLTSNHALSVYSSQGDIKIADVSYRPNGSSASLYVNAKKENFKWFFYVKNGRR
jgi:hypothetical protein